MIENAWQGVETSALRADSNRAPAQEPARLALASSCTLPHFASCAPDLLMILPHEELAAVDHSSNPQMTASPCPSHQGCF